MNYELRIKKQILPFFTNPSPDRADILATQWRDKGESRFPDLILRLCSGLKILYGVFKLIASIFIVFEQIETRASR